MFCECFAVFLQITQNTRKTSANTLENTKELQYACVLRAFSKSQKSRLCHTVYSVVLQKTPLTKYLQNTAKHRKTLAKRKTATTCVLRNFVAQHCKTHAKRTKKNKTLIIQPQYVLRAFGVYFKSTLDLSQKYTMRNTRKLRGVSRTPAGGHGLKKNSVLRCFAVFCGVLRCFVCVFSAFFTKQHKTDQKRYKTHKTNKIRFVQYSAIR